MKLVELSGDTPIFYFARQTAPKYAVYLRNKSTNKRIVRFENMLVSSTNHITFNFTSQHKLDLEVMEGQMVDFAIYGAETNADFTTVNKTPIYLGTALMSDQTINQNYNQVYTQNIDDTGAPIYKEKVTENDYIIYE